LNADQGTTATNEITEVDSITLLTIEKSDDIDPIAPGELLTYTIDYSNSAAATETATNAVITENYDPRVSFVSADPSPTSGNNQWAVGDLTPGESGKIQITVRVNTQLANDQLLNNEVILQSSRGTVSAEEETTIISEALLSINKTGSPEQVVVGNELIYTITYENAAEATKSVTDVVITESYDPHVTFVSATPQPDEGENDRWRIGTLEPGDSGQIQIIVRLNPGTTPGTEISNTATLNSSEAPISSTETTNMVIPIPTLSEWGMIILSFFLIALTLINIRRRGAGMNGLN